jgi:hypothetical protein
MNDVVSLEVPHGMMAWISRCARSFFIDAEAEECRLGHEMLASCLGII